MGVVVHPVVRFDGLRDRPLAVAKRRTGTGLGPLWAYIAVFVVGIVLSLVFVFGGMVNMMNQLRDYGIYN